MSPMEANIKFGVGAFLICLFFAATVCCDKTKTSKDEVREWVQTTLAGTVLLYGLAWGFRLVFQAL